jgi:hypothetical protein
MAQSHLPPAAQTDRLDSNLSVGPPHHLGSVSGHYYSDLSFTALWGSKYGPSATYLSVLRRLCREQARISFVEPRFFGELQDF